MPGGHSMSNYTESMNSSISSSVPDWSKASIKHQHTYNKQPGCLPVSTLFDNCAPNPEGMQSALSLYEAFAALTNTQVQSCSM